MAHRKTLWTISDRNGKDTFGHWDVNGDEIRVGDGTGIIFFGVKDPSPELDSSSRWAVDDGFSQTQ